MHSESDLGRLPGGSRGPSSGVRIVLVSTAILVAGCGDPTRDEVGELRQEYEALRTRIGEVRQQIRDSEARAERAQREAEFQECRGRDARIGAEIEKHRATCVSEIASQQVCKARNERTAAEGGLAGCALGILAAVVTGGSAAPIALGGCGLGLATGQANAELCPTPSCADVLRNDGFEGQVLAESGLRERPYCGGYAGAIYEQRKSAIFGGVRVVEVGRRTYADAVGLAAGDVVLEVNGVSITSSDDLGARLKTLSPGEPLSVTIVRSGTKHRVRGDASAVGFEGEVHRRVQLGITIGAVDEPTYFDSGAAIGVAAYGGPADLAGLLAGDVVNALETAASENTAMTTRDVRRPEDVTNILRETRAGTTVWFLVDRKGRTLRIPVVLAERPV